jgi:Zn finger protein HypA/HybF involved in hydrogenase expression
VVVVSIKDTVRDRLLGRADGDPREYRCHTCQRTFESPQDPVLAACPGCGAHHVRET